MNNPEARTEDVPAKSETEDYTLDRREFLQGAGGAAGFGFLNGDPDPEYVKRRVEQALQNHQGLEEVENPLQADFSHNGRHYGMNDRVRRASLDGDFNPNNLQAVDIYASALSGLEREGAENEMEDLSRRQRQAVTDSLSQQKLRVENERVMDHEGRYGNTEGTTYRVLFTDIGGFVTDIPKYSWVHDLSWNHEDEVSDGKTWTSGEGHHPLWDYQGLNDDSTDVDTNHVTSKASLNFGYGFAPAFAFSENPFSILEGNINGNGSIENYSHADDTTETYPED